MRLPSMPRLTAAEAVTKSTPSNSTDPPEIRHPSRVNPIAARPTLDLPAPDSPIRPSTSPFLRSRSMPLIIGFQTSSDLPSIFRLRILRSCSAIFLFLQTRGFMQHPIYHKIHGHSQQGNRRRGQQRRCGHIGCKGRKVDKL